MYKTDVAAHISSTELLLSIFDEASLRNHFHRSYRFSMHQHIWT